MSARYTSDPDPLAVASSDALPSVDSIRFTEPALDRVDDPARHHKPLDVSALDADPTADREDRDDPDERDNDHTADREEREATDDRHEGTVKAEHNDPQDGVIAQDARDPGDKPEHPQSEAQESSHVTVTLGHPEEDTADQAQPDGTGSGEHEHHHQSDLTEHLHIHTVPTAHLTVLMPPHTQPLPPQPPMQPPQPQQPLKKKRKTYSTEEERRKARILKNRRTAEESRQRRMKRMKELEEYAASSAIREKELQEEARLAKVQLGAMRESMEQVVAQKDAEIATKDAEIERLREELGTR